jgi:hypothetical protein
MAEYLMFRDDKGGTAVLTNETAASRYGIPVLVIDAEDCQGDFGPADLIGDLDRPETLMHAAEVVAAWGLSPERRPEERDAARRYLMQWPAGPQIPGESAPGADVERQQREGQAHGAQ